MSTPTPFETTIVRMVAELSATRVEQIKATDRLREDLGLDSVSSMELLSMLAERFDLDVEMEDAMSVTTVQGVVDMARNHMAGTQAR